MVAAQLALFIYSFNNYFQVYLLLFLTIPSTNDLYRVKV